jgi:small-conductance mechanosensitive channel
VRTASAKMITFVYQNIRYGTLLIALTTVVAILVPAMLERIMHPVMDLRGSTLLKFTLRLTILALGYWQAFNALEINFATFISGLGFFSIGIAFALREIFQNLFSGILLLMFNDLSEGEEITLLTGMEQYKGHIKEINLRNTVIILPDEKYQLKIPNSMMVNNILKEPIHADGKREVSFRSAIHKLLK